MDNSLNILMISHFPRSRARPRSFSVARWMVKRGHHVSLMVTSERSRRGVEITDWDGVRVIEAPDLLSGRLRTGWDFWNLVNRTLYLRKEKGSYDVLHCFETRPATIHPALDYKKRHPGTLFLTDWNDWWGHGGIIAEFRPLWYQRLFGRFETYYEEAFRTRADGLTAIATALARRAVRLGIQPENILHLPGGVETDFFLNRPIADCRQHTGLPAGTPFIGYSSFDKLVEIDFMIAALAHVVRKRPDARLLVTGKNNPQLMELAQASGIAANIHLAGLVPYEELPWYLGCADLFALPFPDKPYNIGRWPNKMGDYIGVGRPVVSNPVGDVGQLIETRRVGLTAEWEPADFGEKILQIIENPQLAVDLGRNARRAAESTYEWANLARRLEEFYHQMLAQKHGLVLRMEQQAV